MRLKLSAEKKDLEKRLFIPAILLAIFLVNSIGYFLSIVLMDIADSFQVTVGTATLLTTITRFCGLIVGLVMGILTLRFKHKSLFLLGIALFGIGILGSVVAVDFSFMLSFQFFLGIGGPMVGVLAYSLIGTYLPVEKRGWAIGLIFSTIFVANVIVTPITGFMTALSGWRSALVWFIFPLSIACLVLGYIALPSETNKNNSGDKISSLLVNTVIPEQVTTEYPDQKVNTLKAFRSILSDRSAIACITATALISIFALTPMYAPSFFRNHFSVSVSSVGLFSAAVAVSGIFGALMAGRAVNRVGRIPLIVISGFASGVANIIFTFVPNVWGSLAFWGISVFAVSITWASLYALVIEQVPIYRSSMISINQTFRYFGAIIGLSVSGLLLNIFLNNYQLLMLVYGSANIVLAVVVLLMAKDPCRNLLTTTKNE